MLEEREDPGGTVRITFSPGLDSESLSPFRARQGHRPLFIEHRQERIDLLLGVHDFNHNWKIHGQTKNFRSVQVT